LAIIRRVQRGPASRDELIEAVLIQEGGDAYGGTDGRVLHRRFQEDMRRIRDELLINVRFDRQLGGYTIRDTWLPLLDLPDDDLATIAWLEETFDMASPQHDEVHALLDKLRLYLGMERLAVIERSRTALTVDLHQRDEDEIAPSVWNGLTKALAQHRQVELLYLSPQYEDGQPRRHRVDPYDRTFDTARGHYYLRAYCRRADTSAGLEEPRCYIDYRVGRILELEVLSQKMSPLPPTAPRYAVVYELAPRVARLGISHQPEIDVQQIERREDGSALVHGETGSVFWAVRALLHYGPNCRVLGGPEMVREMRAVVRGMAEMYARED
jgi:predicted DNA-binding transcriptional regulator YafY